MECTDVRNVCRLRLSANPRECECSIYSPTSREHEVPSFWLAALVGFVAGVAVTFGVMVRKLK